MDRRSRYINDSLCFGAFSLFEFFISHEVASSSDFGFAKRSFVFSAKQSFLECIDTTKFGILVRVIVKFRILVRNHSKFRFIVKLRIFERNDFNLGFIVELRIIRHYNNMHVLRLSEYSWKMV